MNEDALYGFGFGRLLIEVHKYLTEVAEDAEGFYITMLIDYCGSKTRFR